MNKILLFIKIPPPITGATLMNQTVLNSNYLRESFDIRSICISYANRPSDLGSFRLSKLWIFAKTFVELLFELILKKPDLIYFVISPTGLVFIRDFIFVSIMDLFNVRILYHLRGIGIQEKTKSKILKMMYQIAFRNSNIICLSESVSNDIKDVYSGKVYIANNGIADVPKAFINYDSHNIINTILFISNLFIQKGILDYLDALELLNNKKIIFKALIIGQDGDIDKNTIITEIRKRNLQNKTLFMGVIFGEKKDLILSQIDIVVFPTKKEAFGNVIIETFRAGKPIIATIEGSIPEIVEDGIQGFLVDKDSPEQIADKLEYLILNPEIRIQMGKAARKKYEKNYTLQKFEEKLVSILKSVMNQHIK